LIDDLRLDAKRQAVEKVVGTYIESDSLVENYVLISDRILSQTNGMVKRIIKESKPWPGEDGFMHILIKAEVYVGSVQDALKSMSKSQRKLHIKEKGDPKISVSITVKDAERSRDQHKEQSQIAENILKEQITDFGYRVWSKTARESTQKRVADFDISGEAKFTKTIRTLQASGIKIPRYELTSWTISCVYTHTGEEIYFNNQVPKSKKWATEDVALEEIGQLIGKQFSRQFFTDHLSASSQTYELRVSGLPSFDTGALLKKEMIGLRPILNVNFREFNANGESLFEVEFTGVSDNFAQLVNSAVVKALNAKLREDSFKLSAIHGRVIELNFSSNANEKTVIHRFKRTPPSSLANAAPARVARLVQSTSAMKIVADINPSVVHNLAQSGNDYADDALDAVKSF
jgi:hypothetical protein